MKEPLTPAVGLLRVGDLIQVFRDVGDVALLLAVPGRRGGPFPALYLQLDPADDEPPFLHVVPQDFGERAAREGRISAADARSTWTEGGQ